MAQWSRICLQCRTCGFDPWVGKIPWRRKLQPASVFLPEKSHGERSLADYNRKSCRVTWVTGQRILPRSEANFKFQEKTGKPNSALTPIRVAQTLTQTAIQKQVGGEAGGGDRTTLLISKVFTCVTKLTYEYSIIMFETWYKCL